MLSLSEFKPPAIKKNDDYKVEDVIVLYELDKRATYVDDPLRTFTGHRHRFRDGHRFIKFTNVVSHLRKKGLLRVSDANEIVEKLTVPELKDILKSIGEKTTGVKRLLVEKVKQFATDDDILNSTDKRYFVLTESGYEILNKYSNVIWIYRHRDYIFAYSIGHKSRFDEYYFMKKWNNDPAKTLIEFYKTRDSGIVARVYEIINKPEETFHYGIKKFTEDLVLQMNKCKNNQFTYIEHGLGEFTLMPIRDIFNNLNITDDSLGETLQYIYNYSVDDKSLLNYEDYKELIVSLLKNVDDNIGKNLMLNIAERIRSDYGYESDDVTNDVYQENSNSEYEEDNLMDMINSFYDDREELEAALLNLVDELPFDFLDKLNNKVVDRIKKGK